jgi:60 kDa SS-A/Ro ribonucleoprotein
MLHATKNSLDVDAFVIYTDNETWDGNIHPHVALSEYNKKMGKNAKLIVVGMTSTRFSIAKPEDPNMLDVVGFDTATPELISAFIGE